MLPCAGTPPATFVDVYGECHGVFMRRGSSEGEGCGAQSPSPFTPVTSYIMNCCLLRCNLKP